MVYQVEETSLLFPINRSQIIDISVDDVLEIKGFEGASYTWTEHDASLLENNPDDDVFLKVEKIDDTYKATTLILKSISE